MTAKRHESTPKENTLEQLYAEHSGKVSDKWSSYLIEYERILAEYRNKPVRLLEIGIQNGGSLEIWSKYFPKARKLVGCDINLDCAGLNYEDPVIAVVIGDANSDAAQEAIFEHASVLDIIIDDGSHRSSDIVESFARYFPCLSDGGVFIAEDLHCSYWQEYGGGLYEPFSSISFFKRLADAINQQHWRIEKSRTDILNGFFSKYGAHISEEVLSTVHSVQFMNSLCVVRRDSPERNRLDARVLAGSVEMVQPGLLQLHSSLADSYDQTSKECTTGIMPSDEEFPLSTGEFADRDGQIAELNVQLKEKDSLLQGRESQIAELNFHITSMQQTRGWRLLERLRRLLPRDSRRRALYFTFRRVVEVFLDEGPFTVLRRTGHKLRLALSGQGVLIAPQGSLPDINRQYQKWLQRHSVTTKHVARMEATLKTLTYTPCISIVTPVYDPDETWLRKAIESVRSQVYPHWELCLVNDCSTRPHVRSVLDEYAVVDPRIRVKHLDHNEGIAGASTQALNLATGEFVGLLDHDDELSPDALFQVANRLNRDPKLDLLYSDEDKLDQNGMRVEPFFKPDWSPDLLLSMNYITHFSVFRRHLLEQVGGFRPGFDASQGYDLLLRFTEGTDRIAHISQVLYHCRKIPGSAAMSEEAKPHAYKAGQRAIEEALVRRKQSGKVESTKPGRYVVRYQVNENPLVSIIVPTKDKVQLLQQCINSIEEKTSYSRYEIIVIDNGSVEPETLKYLDTISSKWRVCQYPEEFNFAAICNFGAAKTKGDYLLFLNNDTQVIQPEWLAAMLEQAQRPEVGVVGAKLLYPDGRIQHAGVVMGISGACGHAFRYLPSNLQSYFDLADLVRNCSATTAACMMVPRAVFDEVEGFDERLRVAYNDIDICLRIRQRGYLVVYTPLALLYHHESASRGSLHPPEDERLFLKQWGDLIRDGDPYYNPNLTLAREDWSLHI